MAWLVLGRTRRGAGRASTRMLQRWPDDAYALASRAHLQAQAGRHAAPRWPTPTRCCTLQPERRPRLVQPRLPARSGRALGRGRWPPSAAPPTLEPRARPRLVRPGPGADPPAALRRGRRRAEAQHRTAADEPVRLVPAGAGARRSPAARRGGEDHPPPQGLRAEGRRAARARDRAARRARADAAVAVDARRSRRAEPTGARKGVGIDAKETCDASDRKPPQLLAEEPAGSPAILLVDLVRRDLRRRLFRPRPELQLLRLAVQLLGGARRVRWSSTWSSSGTTPAT